MSDWKTKYRPSSIEEFVGNEEIVSAFTSDIGKKNRKRAYLITGPRGCGKTTLARIGTKMLDVDDFNLTEINASDDRGIDTVRELKEQCEVSTGVNRAWIIDEVHMTTKEFQNAILKILEEGNEHDFFFLCTTEPEKLLGTVKSRCGQYNLNFPEEVGIKRLLRTIGKVEGFKISPEVAMKIIVKSEGHIRDAIGFLQSVYELEESKALKYLDSVQAGESNTAEAIALVKCIYAKASAKDLMKCLQDLKDNKENPESLRIFIMNWGAGRLLKSWKLDDALIMENFEKPYFEPSPWSRFVLDCFRAVHS